MAGEHTNDRYQILGDQPFWTRLEYDACLWLKNSADEHARRFWIDGFLPEAVTDTSFGVDIKGTVWVGEGRRAQRSYCFLVSVPQKMLNRRREVFGIERLSLDGTRQMLEIAVCCGNRDSSSKELR
jgi:hypothetical protein